MLKLDSPVPLSCSVDWLTATCRDTLARPTFYALGQRLVEAAVLAGEKSLDTEWKGYELQRAGGYAVGIRPADVMIELKGAAAAQWWIPVHSLATNVARIDLAVTWQPSRSIANLAQNLYRQVGRAQELAPVPMKPRYWETYQGGQTFYLGSPKSDRMLRVYDKGVEMGVRGPGELWRYEVQYRNDPARVVARSLAEEQGAGSYLLSIVATHCKQRLVPTPWAKDADEVPIVVHRADSSDEVRKRWLAATVRPVLRNMLERWAAAELITLLGLG